METFYLTLLSIVLALMIGGVIGWHTRDAVESEAERIRRNVIYPGRKPS